MFGKKKKKVEEQVELVKQDDAVEMEQPSLDDLVEETKIFVESELIEDDELEEESVDLTQEFEAIAYMLKQEDGDDLVAQAVDEPDVAPVEDSAVEDSAVEDAPESEPVEEVTKEPVAQETPVEEAVEDEPADEDVDVEEEVEEVEDDGEQEPEEEVVYIVDEEDEDEDVKPAKLVKLPNLIDYMLMQNMSKRMKINIATLLLSAYNKYKDIPQEKVIIIKCMAKIMQSLMN